MGEKPPTQQLTLDYGAAQRAAELGMRRAIDHADRIEPGWSEQALIALLHFAARTDQFTAEEARRHVHADGLSLPPDGRAWGAVFKRAAARRHIRKIGYAPRVCGNMTPTIVWQTMR